MNRNNRLLQKLCNSRKETLTYEDVLNSPHFKTLLNKYVLFLTESQHPVCVTFVENAKLSAYTDSFGIYVDIYNSIIRSYPTVELKINSLFGFVFHEIGHLMFSDFKLRSDFLDELEKTGKFMSAYADKETMKEVQEYIRKYPSLKKVIAIAMAKITNVVEDIFIEALLSYMFKGSVKAYLLMNRRRMAEQAVSLDDMQKTRFPKQAILYNLIIQYASVGDYNNWQRINDGFTQIIEDAKPIIDDAVRSQTAQGRLNKSTDIFLATWKIMKDEVDDLENRIKFTDGDDAPGQPGEQGNPTPPDEGDIEVNKNSKCEAGDDFEPQVLDALINDMANELENNVNDTSADNNLKENSDLFKGKEPEKKLNPDDDADTDETKQNENADTDNSDGSNSNNTLNNSMDNNDDAPEGENGSINSSSPDTETANEDIISNQTDSGKAGDASDGADEADSNNLSDEASDVEDSESKTSGNEQGEDSSDKNLGSENGDDSFPDIEGDISSDLDSLDSSYTSDDISDSSNGNGNFADNDEFPTPVEDDGCIDDQLDSSGLDEVDDSSYDLEEDDESTSESSANGNTSDCNPEPNDSKQPDMANDCSDDCDGSANEGIISNQSDNSKAGDTSDGADEAAATDGMNSEDYIENEEDESLSESPSEADNSEHSHGSSDTTPGTGDVTDDESSEYDIEDDIIDMDTLTDELKRELNANNWEEGDAGDDDSISELSDEKSDLLKNALNNVLNEIAKEKVGQDLINENERKLQDMAGNADLGDMHKDVTISVNRHVSVTDKDIAVYNAISPEPLKIAKILTRKMEKILRNKQTSLEKNVIFGKRLSKTPYDRQGKIFNKKNIPNETDLAVTLLIDESGSMKGFRINAAKITSIILQNFCESLDIPLQIAGHYSSSLTVRYDVYKDFNESDGKDKYRICQITNSDNGNRDGAALQFAGELLLKRPERNKLLILISDGQPAALNYYGEESFKDLRNIKKRLLNKGVTLFAAAIGDDKEQIKTIYNDNFLDITDLEKLPLNIVRLVERFIK